MQLKIIVAGPKGGGKTLMSNFLCNDYAPEKYPDKLTLDRYDPTAGVRILEAHVKTAIGDANIHLWDASGDSQYESCWRAIMAEADGVILVYNPEDRAQDAQLADWYDYFVRKNGLNDEQCVIYAHRPGNSTEKMRPNQLFSKVAAMVTNRDSGADIKRAFEKFVGDVCYAKRK